MFPGSTKDPPNPRKGHTGFDGERYLKKKKSERINLSLKSNGPEIIRK